MINIIETPPLSNPAMPRICLGNGFVPCTFNRIRKSQPAQAKVGYRHCIFCSTELMETTLRTSSGIGYVRTMLRHFADLDIAIYDAALAAVTSITYDLSPFAIRDVPAREIEDAGNEDVVDSIATASHRSGTPALDQLPVMDLDDGESDVEDSNNRMVQIADETIVSWTSVMAARGFAGPPRIHDSTAVLVPPDGYCLGYCILGLQDLDALQVKFLKYY